MIKYDEQKMDGLVKVHGQLSERFILQVCSGVKLKDHFELKTALTIITCMYRMTTGQDCTASGSTDR